jgi:hypothetical protein
MVVHSGSKRPRRNLRRGGIGLRSTRVGATIGSSSSARDVSIRIFGGVAPEIASRAHVTSHRAGRGPGPA